MATRKKKVSAEPVGSIPDSKPTATQVHKVVTHFTREIPIDEAAEIAGAGAEDEADLEPYELDPEEEFLDEVESFLEQHGIRADSEHTWSMVVERLPDYERNRRNDVGARRKSCGERPFTPSFEEEIRREFARPGLANDFRVTIKRDGKIFKNWPHVVSLEPPPPAIIAEEETRRNAVNGVPQIPYPAYPAPAPVTLKALIEQARQFAELQKYLLPGGAAPAAAGRQIDDEDFALLSLLKLSPELTQKISSKLAGKLFNGAGDHAAEASTSRIVELALENGPAIVDRIFQGLGLFKGGLPAAPEPAPANQESSSQALASIIIFAHAGMTPDYVCDWLIDRSESDESLGRFIDSIAAMDSQTLTKMMAEIKPDMRIFVQSQQMRAFVDGLIHYLNTSDEQEAEAPAS